MCADDNDSIVRQDEDDEGELLVKREQITINRLGHRNIGYRFIVVWGC